MNIAANILPAVREFIPHAGPSVAMDSLRVGNCPEDLRLSKAVRKRIGATHSPGRTSPQRAETACHFVIDRDAVPHAQGYRLDLRSREIVIVGGSAAGCFHGLTTFEHIVRHSLTGVGLPCCTIVDWPDFSTRGLLHDVTRGKVPTLATLKLLADRLAALKVNQLQLYVEHAFTFAFDPEICDADHGLTPDEIRELDVYCKDRFIELVPAIANLGHMGRILSLPRYRHLAEIEPTKSWDEMSWPERARGFTLDCMNQGSFELVRAILSEILDCFSSPVVNICGDEPWDLGKGKNNGLATPRAIGEAYLAHIRRVHDFCASRGRRTQFWSDVVRNHPDLFDRVPRESTVLHWGYDDRADYEGTRSFVETGLDTFVCPGTSGWKRIVNAMDLAERNIHTFAAVGHRCGASGLLNTDWGDHGHFNALACSWHGIALGAVHGWRADHAVGKDFDARFAELGWGLTSLEEVALLREGSTFAEQDTREAPSPFCTNTIQPSVPHPRSSEDGAPIGRFLQPCETWRLFWQSLDASSKEATFPPVDVARSAAERARRLRTTLENRRAATPECDLDRRELVAACRFTELFAARVSDARDRSGGGAQSVSEFRDNLKTAGLAYSEVWGDRNKPSGLADIEAALDRVSEDCCSSIACTVAADQSLSQ